MREGSGPRPGIPSSSLASRCRPPVWWSLTCHRPPALWQTPQTHQALPLERSLVVSGFKTGPWGSSLERTPPPLPFISVFWNFPRDAETWLTLGFHPVFQGKYPEDSVLEHSAGSFILCLPGHLDLLAFLGLRNSPESWPTSSWLPTPGGQDHSHPEPSSVRQDCGHGTGAGPACS